MQVIYAVILGSEYDYSGVRFQIYGTYKFLRFCGFYPLLKWSEHEVLIPQNRYNQYTSKSATFMQRSHTGIE